VKQYHDLVKLVLRHGVRKPSRTGVDTISYFGAFYKVDLAEGFPLLTTKKVNFAACLHELLWFLSGESHIRNFREKSKIWNDWADAEGNLETAYGYYWRNFPSPTANPDMNARPGEMVDFTIYESDGKPTELKYGTVERVVQGVDQIQFVIDELKRNPMSRRLIVSAWEPGNAIHSKLPPCHYTFAFNVTPQEWATCSCGEKVRCDRFGGWKPSNCPWCKASMMIEVRNTLNCHLTQRSGDIALGIPFNLASYATLTQMIAQEVGMELGEFAHTIIDAHIYTKKEDGSGAEFDHVPGLRTQLDREFLPLPKLTIARKPFNELKFEDFTLEGYKSHPAIAFKVAV
jgi:thymidylate synthase